MSLRLDNCTQDKFDTLVFAIETPNGKAFVSIMEDKSGKLCGINVTIGKAGLALSAWAHSFGRILTMAIEHGATLEELISELSSQTSDQSRMGVRGLKCSSGPEAVYIALMDYRRDKFERLTNELKIKDVEDAEPRKGRFNYSVKRKRRLGH